MPLSDCPHMPLGGFNDVWRDEQVHPRLVRLLKPDSGNGLWARTSETAFSGAIQQFEGGWLFWNGNVCFVLLADGTWTMF